MSQMTRGFDVTVRLDSPLLQGGPAPSEVDSPAALRGREVRGLLHTFARAIAGPLLGRDPTLTRRAEALLLGESAGAKARPPTFRVFDVTEDPMPSGDEPFHTCPHQGGGRGSRTGHPPGSRRTLRFRIRPAILDDRFKESYAPHFPEALWALVWIAVALGSLGNRSRRGYGSLTLVDAQGVPSLTDVGDPPLGQLHTNLGDFSMANQLAQALHTGFCSAQHVIAAFLKANGFSPTQPAASPEGNAFFQIASPDQIYVGEVREGATAWEAIMRDLMSRCGRMNHPVGPPQQADPDTNLRIHQRYAIYGQTMGSAANPRLASPMWVRLYQLASDPSQGEPQWAPVATYSPRAIPANEPYQVLKTIRTKNGIEPYNPPQAHVKAHWRYLEDSEPRFLEGVLQSLGATNPITSIPSGGGSS